MKKLVLLLLLATFSFTKIGLSQSMDVNALDVLTGEKWKGELMYRNYSDNEEVRMPAELLVTKLKPGVYQFAYFYPDEPKANSTSRVKISNGGKKIAGNRLVDIKRKGETLIVKADGKGADDREAAWFYFTYELSSKRFTTTKEVQYKKTKDRFVRNQYVFTRE